MYSINYLEGTTIFPLKFNINNRIGVSKFKIEELDMLTSRYLSEELFLKELLKYYDNITPECGRIVINLSRTSENKEIPVIYNDKLIYEKSKEIRIKKQCNSNKLVLLDKDLILINFISFIKRLAKNRNSRLYILEPDSLKNIPYNLRKELKKLVRDDSKRYIGKINDKYNYEIVDKGIKSLLKEYVILCDAIDYKMINNENTLELEQERIIIEEKIDYYFRKDYRNLREMVAFENKYLEVLNWESLNSKADSELINACLIQEVRIQKAVRNDYLEQSDLTNFYDSMESNVLTGDKEFIESDVIRNLYIENGIPGIMDYLSADQIYGKYLEDSKRLGIVKKNNIKK